MKKHFNSVLTAFLFVLVLVTGCSKQQTGVRVPLPDISTFAITNATPFAAGMHSTVTIYSTTLGSGTYKVYFDLTGSNTLLSQSATLVMSNNYGTFKTPDMPNPGETFLTLNSIANVNGGGTSFVTNNKYTISDSTGIMTAIIGGNIACRATDILSTYEGNKLTIRAVSSEPYSSSMTIVIDSFTRTNGVIDFSARNVPEVVSIQYQIPGGGFLSATGTLNIMSISPTMSGTFSFTGMDSTAVTNGVFNLPTPNL